jgi:hypothetical protein
VPLNRYPADVLSPEARRPARPTVKPVVVERDLVLEDALSGYCGAVVAWENGLVVLEDRRGHRRSFPFGPGLLLEGQPVDLRGPTRTRLYGPGAADGADGCGMPGRRSGSGSDGPGRVVSGVGSAHAHTRSGSLATPTGPAKVAQASRMWVEGRHDAELIERVWGDDLRHIGVVVEPLGGIDHLVDRVAGFGPTNKSRLGVLVDHLEPGSKETRIAHEVEASPYRQHVLVLGHRYIDVWQAVEPSALGLAAWPTVPRGTDFKQGTCRALGWPWRTPADLAQAWRRILNRVTGWKDLDRAFVTNVERLIDFVQEGA